MTESNVDMLRLEYPRTALEVYTETETDLPTIDLPNPTAWVRLLVTQHQQAQWDLEQLHGMCADAYNRVINESLPSSGITNCSPMPSNTFTKQPRPT